MATAPSINLLERSDLDSPIGRITTWAVTYGRYIMIGTEIVVLLAFIARFSLDRKLTDLKEEISQKQAILVANAPFEQEVRDIQDRLGKIKSITTDESKLVSLITLVQTILPQDVYLTSLDIASEKLIIDATAGSTEGFSQFLTSLSSASDVRDVEIGDIQKQPGRGIQFKLTVQLGAKGKK